MDILPDKSVQALQRVVRGFQQDRDLRGYAVFALGFRPDETKTFYIAGGVIPDDAMYGALENMIEAMFSRSDQLVLPPEAQETQQ